MTCPNGHTGGMFCCMDNVNQVMATFVERYEKWGHRDEPLLPVTLEQWKAYKKLAKEQEEGGE